MKADVLVIGSGIAGLTYALKTAQANPDLCIVIITKAAVSETNTKYAQGGIAVVQDLMVDSFEQHIADTLKAGDGLCDRQVVEQVVREAPLRLLEIIEWGARFDQEQNGKLQLGREGGHSSNRIIHHKDMTGREIEQALLKQVRRTPNIRIEHHFFAIDLITSSNGSSTLCQGAYVLNEETQSIEAFTSHITLLAAGGAGQVYQTTTNPEIATGDGVAMAHRAGAKLANMEFVQFHPTAFYEPGKSPAFLISEAVRGFGAILRNSKGETFMAEYDPNEELASRDIVSRAIDTEVKAAGSRHVWLDLRHLDMEVFNKQFPTIAEKCREEGIDLETDMIPVVPAAHYMCGGIQTDLHGRTSIQNLYACGECACTGLHGANRLASNSLLEALVFAHHCFEDTLNALKRPPVPVNTKGWENAINIGVQNETQVRIIRNELRQLMTNKAGIVRSDKGLADAERKIQMWQDETKELVSNSVPSVRFYELCNLLEVASMIIGQARSRRENRGGHFNIDLVKEPAFTE